VSNHQRDLLPRGVPAGGWAKTEARRSSSAGLFCIARLALEEALGVRPPLIVRSGGRILGPELAFFVILPNSEPRSHRRGIFCAEVHSLEALAQDRSTKEELPGRIAPLFRYLERDAAAVLSGSKQS
jgi:hypothetical protein